LQLANDHQGAADGPPTPLYVVPVEIGLRALAGSKRFDIRLDPAELGRIDVNLEISDKGEVSAKLVVDRVETLHLLQRDARTLERAFEQAGLKPTDAGVDITLRDQNDQSGFRQNRQDEQAARQAHSTSEAEIDDIAIAAQPTPIRRLVRLGGVDLSI
jgi:flagellar hook-length control protein FliK